jgi:hypothetical protein
MINLLRLGTSTMMKKERKRGGNEKERAVHTAKKG